MILATWTLAEHRGSLACGGILRWEEYDHCLHDSGVCMATVDELSKIGK